MSVVKRKVLSISEKVEIIRELDSGNSNLFVSRMFGLSTSTVSTIWKNREIILSAFENNLSKCKKLKKCEKSDLDEALLSWYKIQKFAGLPINGSLLRGQAEKFAHQLGYSNFNCNSGWIDRFKNRHNITYYKGPEKGVQQDISVNPKVWINSNDESDLSLSFDHDQAMVEQTVMSDWTNDVWPSLREGYSDEDIYNTDETGLFYSLTPDDFLRFKDDARDGNCNDMLTILLCTNMMGTDKRKLVIIGKSSKRKCLKNVYKGPVEYKSNKKAWMTAEIFENELRNWDKELEKSNRKILLLVDLCPAHPALPDLLNIKLVFLPPNVTNLLQPMVQGIIANFKSHYRRLQILNLLECKDDKPTINNGNKMTVLKAIRLITDAWNLVTPLIIRNCFKKAGVDNLKIDPDDREVPLLLSEWLKLKNINYFEDCWEELDEFVNVDNEAITSGVPTAAEMLLQNSLNSSSNSVKENEASDSEPEEIGEPSVTWTEAENAFNVFTKFIESRSSSSDDIFQHISSIRNKFIEMKYESQIKKEI